VIPEDLRYSSDHEWIRTLDSEADTEDTGGISVARIGITDYAQNSLGDIVFVQMPEPGTTVEPGDSIGEVESTKSVSDIFAPVSGTVVARNDALDAAPELVNSDPYGDGWMIEIELADPGQVGDLLDAAGYAETIGES
jgi:glycine cleavage system H protein